MGCMHQPWPPLLNSDALVFTKLQYLKDVFKNRACSEASQCRNISASSMRGGLVSVWRNTCCKASKHVRDQSLVSSRNLDVATCLKQVVAWFEQRDLMRYLSHPVPCDAGVVEPVASHGH
eukprot:12427462-Karenia_brevis.AAC.1